MTRLFVWMRLADTVLRLIGELGATEPSPSNGQFRSEFEYARDWTDFPGAFPLDPESLPLNTSSRRFGADLFHPPLSILDDSLPDDWGRALLTALLRSEGRRPTQMEVLPRMRVATGVDDHLKNFWMLAKPEGYRLAPAFDLVPDISGRGEHTLHFNTSTLCPNREELLELASTWDVSDAKNIIEQVVAAADTFTTSAKSLGVKAPASLKHISKDVRRRTAHVGGGV